LKARFCLKGKCIYNMFHLHTIPATSIWEHEKTVWKVDSISCSHNGQMKEQSIPLVLRLVFVGRQLLHNLQRNTFTLGGTSNSQINFQSPLILTRSFIVSEPVHNQFICSLNRIMPFLVGAQIRLSRLWRMAWASWGSNKLLMRGTFHPPERWSTRSFTFSVSIPRYVADCIHELVANLNQGCFHTSILTSTKSPTSPPL